MKAIKETVPLSTTQREQIVSLRSWAQDRAVLATSPQDREENNSDDDDAKFISKQGGRIVDFGL